jgi:hypothetical protein
MITDLVLLNLNMIRIHCHVGRGASDYTFPRLIIDGSVGRYSKHAEQVLSDDFSIIDICIQ